jgi:hypothetical protein
MDQGPSLHALPHMVFQKRICYDGAWLNLLASLLSRMNKDVRPHISQLLQGVDYGYPFLSGVLLLTPGRVIYTRLLGSCWVMLSEVHAANPPNGLRSFEIFNAVVDEEAFGGVLHPCLLHSLPRQTDASDRGFMT